ncbi:glutathione S-transferase family protein [Crenobacter cavernae]|uniref:Glutathione S-transferase family protein n=1 Tax=Crenobacter cavernae TaxID=2290923 RepID=A0ABY0FIG2_9NEIS|nr:glutathione S-transferase family protein [Crenobacter cavernae]RXZ44834.1 glutathione S-transferase family protein [Crenobacter cavernae]
MITLYTFGPEMGLPDPSPFVMKAEILLKMAGLPYRTRTRGFHKAPHGKLPYIDGNGQEVADSSFIRSYLERQYGIDFDAGYSRVERAFAWSVEKMLEEHLYFAIEHMRWTIDENFRHGPARFFRGVLAPLRPLVRRATRRKVVNRLRVHGLGFQSMDEIAERATRDIDALATILGSKPYLLGETPSGADATVFAFVASVLCPVFETSIRTNAERHANLKFYCERMWSRYYPWGDKQAEQAPEPQEARFGRLAVAAVLENARREKPRVKAQ